MLKLTSQKRISVLGKNILHLIPDNIHLRGLDVGCGAGEIASDLMDKMDNIKVDGVEVVLQEEPKINIMEFDGKNLPFHNNSYDFVLLIDVLHHTNDPLILLEECVRVARRFIVIKDHICDSKLNRMFLSFSDWLGNRKMNIHMPFNFLSSEAWNIIYEQAGLTPVSLYQITDLYPKPVYYLWGKKVDFIAKLQM